MSLLINLFYDLCLNFYGNSRQMKSLPSTTHCECTKRFQLLLLFSEETSSESNSSSLYTHPSVLWYSKQDTLHVSCVQLLALIMSLFKLLCSLQETCVIVLKSIPVAAWSKTWVYGRSLVGIAGLNPAGGVRFCECCVLSGRVLCVGLITSPEESYHVLWCLSLIANPR